MSLIDDFIAKGEQSRAQLRVFLYRHEYPGNTKNLVLMAYVDIALEYHAAIWLLIKSKLYGSAFAMVRLVFDTMLRAYWINKVATEQQIEQAGQDELTFPRMAQMRKDIKERYGDKANPKEMELLFRRGMQRISYQTRCSPLFLQHKCNRGKESIES